VRACARQFSAGGEEGGSSSGSRSPGSRDTNSHFCSYWRNFAFYFAKKRKLRKMRNSKQDKTKPKSPKREIKNAKLKFLFRQKAKI
jgi:hypothetical protein